MRPKDSPTRPRTTPAHRAQDRRAEVIRGILRRELAGMPLHAHAVERAQRDLFNLAIRHYRTWGLALTAAGLDAAAISARRIWTEQRVIQAIHELHGQRIALNYGSVRKHDQGLIGAAYKLFGAWSKTLVVAGYDPEGIRKSRRPWTKSELIAHIQRRVAEGSPLTQYKVIPDAARFAVRRLFGSFPAALRAAGVLQPVEKFSGWSRAAVVAAIRQRHASGQPIHCLGVIADHSKLYYAGRIHCGSWRQALRTAGFDPEQIRRARPRWTAKDVLAELRRRARINRPAATISDIRPTSLMRACNTFFGSLEAAAAAARIDPATIGCRRCVGRRCRRYRGGRQGHAPQS